MTSLPLLLLLALSAAAQTPPQPAQAPSGKALPEIQAKQFPNHNGGLVTYYSGNRLSDDQSRVATNVFFDRDSGVTKRGGQQLYGAISGCTAQVRSAGNYLSPAGNSYLFEACGNHVYVSAGDGNFSVIGGTISSTANVYMKQGLGAEWIVDGVDALWSTNGVTVSSYPAAPIAQYVGIFQGRVALGNVVGGVSAIYLSGYNNGGDYSLPAVIIDTSPAIFGLNGLNDGRTVTCISDGYRDVLILWNRDEMYGLYGSGNSSFVLRKLAEIGCDEQESVQEFDGKLRWLAQYGIYQYDGLNTQRISDPIKDQILNIVASEPGSLSLTQDSLVDWTRGNLAASGAGAAMSDTIVSNSVVPGTATFVDNTTTTFVTGALVNVSTSGTNTLSLAITTNTIAGGTFATSSDWTVTAGGGCVSASVTDGATYSCAFRANNATVHCPTGYSTCAIIADPSTTCTGSGLPLNYLCVYDGATGTAIASYALGGTDSLENVTDIASVAKSTSVYLRLSNFIGGSCASTTATPRIVENTTTPGGFNLLSATNRYCDSGIILTFSNIRVSSHPPTGTYTSPTFDTTFSTPTMSVAALSFSSNTTATMTLQEQNSADGTTWSSSTTLINGAQPLGGKRYWRYVENFATTVGTMTATSNGLSSLGASTTGYFITGCFPVAPISSWGLLQSLNNPGNGVISYSVSTGAACDAVQQATATWTAQSLNTTISVATAAYIGVRVLFNGFTPFVAATQPTLNGITVNWNSAAGRPRMATQVFDNRYWMAYTTSTAGGAFNDKVLVYDSMGHWSGPFRGVNAASFVTYKRTLYAGSSLSDGNVLVENTGSSDLAAPILFDFRTPDYELDAFNTVDLYDINLEFETSEAGYSPNTSVQYYVDRGTTPYSLGNVTLTSAAKGLVYSNARFGFGGAPTKAHTISFEILDNTATPITFYRSMLRYTPMEGP